MRNVFASCFNSLWITAVIVSLGLLSQAHTAAPLDLTAYAMPDGTLPQLCLDASGTEMATGHCPACHLVSAAILPKPQSFLLWQMAPKAALPSPKLPLKARFVQAELPQARAPPIAFLV